MIRIITTDGKINTFAGSGCSFYYCGYGGYQGDGGFANKSLLNNPQDIKVDSKGNVFISDSGIFIWFDHHPFFTCQFMNLFI